jgi:hypothetical protein
LQKKFNKNASDFPTLEYLGTVRSALMNKYGIGIIRKNYGHGTEKTPKKTL